MAHEISHPIPSYPNIINVTIAIMCPFLFDDEDCKKKGTRRKIKKCASSKRSFYMKSTLANIQSTQVITLFTSTRHQSK